VDGTCLWHFSRSGQREIGSPNINVTHHGNVGGDEDPHDYHSVDGIFPILLDVLKTNIANFATFNTHPEVEPVFSVEAADGGTIDAGDKSANRLVNGPEGLVGRAERSDRFFHYASFLAEQVAAAYPGNRINVLAYSNHTSVPLIPLSRNLLVQVSPYGHNGDASHHDVVAEAWRQKAERDGFKLGVYDYIGLNSWSRGRPTISYRTMAKRGRYWARSGFVANSGEGSTALFASSTPATPTASPTSSTSAASRTSPARTR
jgi:hypothetical protein